MCPYLPLFRKSCMSWSGFMCLLLILAQVKINVKRSFKSTCFKGFHRRYPSFTSKCLKGKVYLELCFIEHHLYRPMKSHGLKKVDVFSSSYFQRLLLAPYRGSPFHGTAASSHVHSCLKPPCLKVPCWPYYLGLDNLVRWHQRHQKQIGPAAFLPKGLLSEGERANLLKAQILFVTMFCKQPTCICQPHFDDFSRHPPPH